MGDLYSSDLVKTTDNRLSPVSKDWYWQTGEALTVYNPVENGTEVEMFGLFSFYGTSIGSSSPYGVVDSVMDTNEGLYATFETPATTGSMFYFPFADDGTLLYFRKKYPRFSLRFKLDHTTNFNVFAGFTSFDYVAGGYGIATNYGTDWLNGKSGIGLYVTSGGNFRVGHNDGSGATNFSSDLATIDNTTWHTIYIEADEANARWGYAFDNSNMTYLTSEVPGQTTKLAFWIWGETRENSLKRLCFLNARSAQRSQ